jgi:hypothetical protein
MPIKFNCLQKNERKYRYKSCVLIKIRLSLFVIINQIDKSDKVEIITRPVAMKAVDQ